MHILCENNLKTNTLDIKFKSYKKLLFLRINTNYAIQSFNIPILRQFDATAKPTNGGPSGGSSMRRPGSEDPHQVRGNLF